MAGLLKYLRVSTERQEEEGYGLDVQEAGCNSFAAREGLQLLEPAITDDISGDLDQRPGLARLLAMLRAGQASGVVVHRPDRLARKTWVGMRLLEEIHGLGAEVYFTNLGRIENTPEGRFSASIHFSVGELDKAHILKKLYSGRQSKAGRGIPINQGHAPLGYAFEGRGKQAALVVVPEEAEIIKLIYSLYLELRGIVPVVEELSRRRIPTYEDIRGRANSHKQREYGLWSHETVNKILKHPVYRGRFPHFRTYKVKTAQGKIVQRSRPLSDPAIVWVDVPAIISPEVWEQVQETLSRNQQRGGHNAKAEYLLRGLVKCGSCGGKAGGRVLKGGGGRYLYYYLCHAANQRKMHLYPCSAPCFRKELVEERVWEFISKYMLDPDGLERAIGRMQDSRGANQQRLETELADVQGRLADIQTKKQRLISLATNGIFTLEEVAGQKLALDGLEQTYQQSLADVEAKLGAVAAAERQVQALREFGAHMQRNMGAIQSSPKYKRALLEILGIEAVLVVEDGRQYVDVTSYLNPEQAERLSLLGEQAIISSQYASSKPYSLLMSRVPFIWARLPLRAPV